MADKRLSLGNLESIYGKFSGSIDTASTKYGVPKELITTMIAQESGGSKSAVSGKSAKGLMQIMPDTHKELLRGEKELSSDPFDPHSSIMLGAKYISQLTKRYKGNTELALGAYNAGAGNVKDKLPNFPETQQYVKNIKSAFENYQTQSKLPKEKRQYLDPTNDFTLDRALSQRNADISLFKKSEFQASQQQKASTGDWWSEAWDTFARATPTAKVIDEMQMRGMATADPNYKYDQGVVSNDFTRSGISFTPENTDFMAKAVSAEDYNNRLDLLNYHNQLDNLAMGVLSRKAFDNFTMGGMTIGDPTIGLSISAIPRALSAMRLGARMTSAYGSAIGLQAGIAGFKNEYVAGYNREDAIVDTLFGGIVDGTLAKGIFKPVSKIVDDPTELISVRQSTMSVVHTPSTINVATTRNYQWGVNKPFDKTNPIESHLKDADEGLPSGASPEIPKISPNVETSIVKGQKEFNKILKGINSHIGTQVRKTEAIAKEMLKVSDQLPDPSLDPKTIKGSLDRQREIFTRMKSAVDELNYSFSNSLNSLMVGRFSDDIERGTFLNDLTKAINSEFGSNIKLAWDNGQIVHSGGITFKVKGSFGKNKTSKLTIALGALTASSIAFASDGNDEGIAVVPWVIGIGLAYGLGSTAILRVLEKKGMQDAAKDYFKNVKQSEKIAMIKSDPLYKRAWKAVSDIDNYRTGYMESMAYIIKHGTPEQIDLGRKLVRDWVDPQKGIASDSEKLSNVRASESRLAIEADKQFDAYLLETGAKDDYSPMYGAIGKESPTRQAFEESVADYLEFGGDAPASIKAYANSIKKERDLAIQSLTDNGVTKFLGEDVAKFKDNYFTRYLNRGNWQKIINNPINREKLVQSLSGAMAKAMGKSANDPDMLALADTYIQTVTSIHLTNSTTMVPDVKAMLSQMKKLGMDVGDVDVDAFVKEIHRDSDALSRGKIRIPMDLRALKPFDVVIDGETHIINKSKLFDRDAMNVTKRYLNETYGYSAAVKTTNYKSYGLLLDAISKSGTNPEVAVKLKTYADSIFGRPTLDTASETTQNAIAMKAGANAVLALSTLTTSFELLKAVSSTFGKDGSKLARQQFLMSTGNLVKGMFRRKDFNKTWLAKMMTNNVNGLGGATLRGDVNFKAIDDLVNITDMSSGNFREVIKRVGFFGLKLSHLIQLDDFYKNMANVYAATNLARVVHGKNIFDAGKMSMYGIDDAAMSKLRRFLKLDENDEILEFDFDSLPQGDKDLFRNISERIVMDRSTWTALGAIPTGMINNSAGVLLSSLTHFMTQTYTTQFIAKSKHGGMSNYSDMALWVLSGYTTYYAKAYATGKDPKHEDAIMYAILSSPIMSPVNVAGMMIDPVSLSVMSRISDYAKSNAEYGVEELTK